MFVSVTRLRLRSWRFLPGFALHSLRSRSQIRSSPGFLRGCFARDSWLSFWTITIWTDELSMKAFRNSGAHLKAMPRLSNWCDEASYVHWEQRDDLLPTGATVFDRLRDTGKLSKVRRPSPAHARGDKIGKAPPTLVGAFHSAKAQP